MAENFKFFSWKLISFNNIKIIHGAPYSPHLQGIAERIHLTIRKALIYKYIENQNNFNITIELPIIMNKYNNTVHKTTKHTPYEVFYSHNKDLFLEVYNNTVENFNKNNNVDIKFEEKEKCLLIINVIK